jgi:putative peptidoglycan lipid II flippase
VRMSITTVVIKIAVNFLLIIPLGFLGLALATTIASWLNFVLLARGFNKRTAALGRTGEFAVFLRIALASLIMGLIAFLALSAARWLVPMPGKLGLALHLGSAIAVGLAILLPLLRWFRVEEERELSRIVSRLVKRFL